MADQLREARRRRILENSEKRLQKILGHAGNRDEESTTKFPTSVQETNPVVTVCESIQSQTEDNHIRKRIHEQDAVVTTPHIPENVTPLQVNDTLTVNQMDIHETTSSSQESEKSLFFSSVIICFLAVASVSLLTFGYGSLIGQNALIPFLLFTIYKMVFSNLPEKQPSGLVNAAIMLSGIPTNTLSKITKILGTSSCIIQDLCLYMFMSLIAIQFFQSF